MQPPSRDPKHVSPGAIATVILLGMIAVIVLIVSNNVFVVKSIEVEGNRIIEAAEIIRLSGIRMGDSIFSLNTTKIRDAINTHEYLEYIGIWKRYPDHVILAIEEDMPRAQTLWMGTLILLGKEGIILDRTNDISIEVDVPVITGLQMQEASTGKPLVAAQGQLDAVNRVLEELIAQNELNEISELNVAILDNMYLITGDGLQVKLGTLDSLSAKITQMRAMLRELRQGQASISGGVLDVTTGKLMDYQAPQP